MTLGLSKLVKLPGVILYAHLQGCTLKTLSSMDMWSFEQTWDLRSLRVYWIHISAVRLSVHFLSSLQDHLYETVRKDTVAWLVALALSCICLIPTPLMHEYGPKHPDPNPFFKERCYPYGVYQADIITYLTCL